MTLACDVRWHAAGFEVADGLSWTSREALLQNSRLFFCVANLMMTRRFCQVALTGFVLKLFEFTGGWSKRLRRADETLRWLSSPRRGLFLFWLVISQCCFQRKIIIIYHRNLSDLFWLENDDSAVAIIHSVFIFTAPIWLACLWPVAIRLVIQTEQQLQRISDKVWPNSWNMKRFGVVLVYTHNSSTRQF